eukprot:TRINITY_DN479_c0_g1_i1.p1 TRINITY_DN479_c0_g1~~TRINITY_DN479_c0_g1_i1.p1  ORF type:complete len:242 (+),score=43.79 TRINITY_DN479_c0_g1_i1:617-1342(+)
MSKRPMNTPPTPKQRIKDRITLCTKGQDDGILIAMPKTYKELTEMAMIYLHIPVGTSIRMDIMGGGQIYDWSYELVRDNDVIEVSVPFNQAHGSPKKLMRPMVTSAPVGFHRGPVYGVSNEHMLNSINRTKFEEDVVDENRERERESIEEENKVVEKVEYDPNEVISVIVNGREIGANSVQFELKRNLGIGKLLGYFKFNSKMEDRDTLALYYNDIELDTSKTTLDYGIGHEDVIYAREQR